MTIDQFTNLLVSVTLIELMAAIGLGVTFTELGQVASNWLLVARAGLANYVLFPAVTIGLLFLFDASPIVAAGFLILAACPGALFGPPFTAIAKGNVAESIGMMVVLAGSSALIAPVLLHFLLQLTAGSEAAQVDVTKIVVTLLVTQLAPLAVGVSIRHWRPLLAERLQKPANLIGKLLNLAVVGLILSTQYHLLADIRLRGYFGMLLLLLASLAIGGFLGGPGTASRRAMMLTTSLRNVGVGLVIATGSFAGTPAVTAVVVYGLFEVAGSLLLALWWGRQAQGHGENQKGSPSIDR